MPQIVHIGPAEVSPLAREARVRMRDGVHLAADVYLPGAPDDPQDAPGDTVLVRLPYDKSGAYTFIPLIAEHFMARGYRVVAQDVRGKFRSDGEALLFVNEAQDGYDTRPAAPAHTHLAESQFVGLARSEPGHVCIRVFRLR